MSKGRSRAITSLSYSATYRPDLACLYKEGGSHHLLADLKFLDPLSSVMTSIGRAGARVGFGNTRQLAEEKVLGRAARGDQNEGTFNPSKNTGHVSASPADYADALSKGHTVIPLLFETFGGFSPAAMRLLRRLRDQVSNTLSHAHLLSMRRPRVVGSLVNGFPGPKDLGCPAPSGSPRDRVRSGPCGRSGG